MEQKPPTGTRVAVNEFGRSIAYRGKASQAGSVKGHGRNASVAVLWDQTTKRKEGVPLSVIDLEQKPIITPCPIVWRDISLYQSLCEKHPELDSHFDPGVLLFVPELVNTTYRGMVVAWLEDDMFVTEMTFAGANPSRPVPFQGLRQSRKEGITKSIALLGTPTHFALPEIPYV